MYNKLKIFIAFYISFGVLFIALCLVFMLKEEQKYQSSKLSFQKVNFIGEYTLQGKSKPEKIPEDAKIELSGYNTLILRGHFQENIPENVLLNMRIDNLNVRIFHNDQLIYSFGEAGTYPKFAKSAGNVWGSFISPGFSPNDELRIELRNIYTNHVEKAFESFLNGLYYGYDSELFVNKLRGSILNILSSIFILSLGLVALAFSIALIYIKEPNLSIFCFSCLSLSCGIWFFIDFDIQHYFIPYSVFNNSLDIVSLLLVATFSLIYIAVNLNSKIKYLLFAYACLSMLLAIVATICQILGIYDYYEFRTEINIITLGLIILLTSSVIYEKALQSEKYFIFSSIILSMSMLADLICIYLAINQTIFWFKFGFFIFVIIQFWGIMSYLKMIISRYTKVQVLQQLAYKDSLTGIKNRTAYLEKTNKLEKQIKAKTAKFAVIVFDVNNLKETNDNLGHEIGDTMLINSCKIICITFKKSPVFRIGGDEFVAILENSDLEEASELQAQFEQEIEEYNQEPEKGISISIAYGLAFYQPYKDFNYNDVFKRADKSMYSKKMEMKENDF